MNLRQRIARLESVAILPEPPFVLVVLVPARDGKPHGTEGGIKRIHCGDRTWLRHEGESVDDFAARARADVPARPSNWTGMAAVYAERFTADFGGVAA